MNTLPIILTGDRPTGSLHLAIMSVHCASASRYSRITNSMS